MLDLPSEEKVRNIDVLLERATALNESLTKGGMATLSQSEVLFIYTIALIPALHHTLWTIDFFSC